jgi:hypothetical protein
MMGRQPIVKVIPTTTSVTITDRVMSVIFFQRPAMVDVESPLSDAIRD